MTRSLICGRGCRADRRGHAHADDLLHDLGGNLRPELTPLGDLLRRLLTRNNLRVAHQLRLGTQVGGRRGEGVDPDLPRAR